MIDINDYTDEHGRFDGRYLLIRPLSTDGATADVWLSLDLNTVAVTDGDKIDKITRMSDEEIDKLGLMVAIKIYRPQNALDIEGEQRFRDEYMIVFNCHHTNLIHPTNFSICKDTPYLVLPYCKQGSSELLIGNKFSDEEIWKYIQDVASGLAYLHALEPPIVHQDVKPANVLLDDTGHYALTDFGISAQRGGVHGYYFDDENSGTMAYMAPERFQKDAEPMAQSDIWGFGATLCEILTGKVPFGEEGGRYQAEGHPIPAIPDVSSDVHRLILDCLALQPEDRPTAQQIAEAARARQYPVKSRKPLILALLSLLVLLIAGGLYYYSVNAPKPEAGIDLKKDQFEYARNLLDYSYGKTDSVKKGLDILDSLSSMRYVPAQLELVKTIGPDVTNEQSFLKTKIRKKNLNIECDSIGWPIDNKYITKSINILEQIIQQRDSDYAQDNYFAAYTLARLWGAARFYDKYPDAEKLIKYYDIAIEWAKLSGDTILVNKVTKTKTDIINSLIKDKVIK